MRTELIIIRESMWNELLLELDSLKAKYTELAEEKSAYKKALYLIKNEQKEKKAVGISLDYTKEKEGRRAHKKLVSEGILDADFGATYFGCFKSKDAFAYFKLYGSNGICAIPGCDYRDYADEIFKEDFAFKDGHVFMK